MTKDGEETDLYTLINTKGMSAQITNFGATLVSLRLPRQDNGTIDITLGHDALEDYEQGTVDRKSVV